MGLESLPTRNEDFNAFERFDLLTDEPRFVEAQVRNTIFAKIAALAGLLIAILNMSFVWMLYHRDNTGTYIWTAIWMSILSGFFFLYLLWTFKASIGVKSGVQPGPNFTFLVFISSLVFIGYLLVQSTWLFVHKKIHFNFLVDFSKDESAWKLKFSNGTSLAEVWKQDNRMILWIVFLNAVLAVLLAFITYTARSVSWNRYSLARSSLYLAQLTIAGSAWLTIFWVQEALNYRDSLPGYFLGNLLTVAKVCAIVALLIAGANSIVNYFQIKIGYLVIARVQIILVIAMFIAAGITFRELRNATITGLFPGGCTATQYSINEAALDSRWCAVGGKYLAVGQMGQKSELVTRWENNNEIRTLNPSCCESSNYYYIYPFMMVGFWSLVCMFSTVIAAGSNLYIAETNEYLLLSNRTSKYLDILGLSSVLLMIAAWTVYMTLKGKSSHSSNPNFAAFNDPANNPIPGFDLVPDALKVTADSAAAASSLDCLAFNSTGACISSPSALHVANFATLQGRLHFGPKEDKNFNIHKRVTIAAYQAAEKIGEVSLLAGGIFKIQGVPRYSNSRYILTLDINDPTGVFLQKKVDVLVDFAGSKDEILSAGYIRMNTRDGNLCSPTDTLCLTSQKLRFGSLHISIADGSNVFSSVVSDPLSGVSNLLLRWWQITGQTVEEITSDASGILQFNNLPYDSYTVISSKTGFRPVLTRVDLQSQNQVVPSVIMRPLIDNYDMRIQTFINEPNVDFDLHLVVESDKGTTCTVSPLNKYCAYSASINDQAFGNGLEEIVIKKLAVATYMTYMAPSPPYNTNCLVAHASSSHLHQSHSQAWNWNEFKQTSHLSELSFNSHSFGKSVYSIQDFDHFYEKAAITNIFHSLEHIVEDIKKDEGSHMPPMPVVHEHTSSDTKTWEITKNETNQNNTQTQTMPGINGTISSNFSESYEIDNCNVKVTFLDYNNNTANAYVNVSTTLNFTHCDNGTNFTTNTTEANVFGFDLTEALILNSTFKTDYQNGTSLVVINNSNFTFPNGTFTLIRGNSSNSSIVTGINTSVNNPPSYSINVNNTNHTYNETITQILNPNSSNLTNSSFTTVMEFDFFNTVLDQNFSSNTSMIFYPEVNLTGNGTENSSSFRIYSFGNVTLNETCNISNLTNGSSLITCIITNFTVFSNGTNTTIYSTTNNTFAPSNMEGTVIVQWNTNATSTSENRTENYTSTQIPNGTNSTLDILNISTNFSNNTSQICNFSWNINDTNNTITTVMNDTDLVNLSNGTSYNNTYFFNNTIILNDSNYTIIIVSNTTTNDTNEANSTFMELNISNLTVNSTNFTELVINATFEANTSSNLPNYSNFSNVTHIWNNTTSIQVFVNDSNVSKPNGTSYNVTLFMNNITVVNDSNYTIIIVSNTTTNNTNEANSTFMELNISNLTVNSTNFSELVINATFEANTSSNLPNYSNFSNVTHIWNNTTSIQVFVNDSNVSKPNGTSYNVTLFMNNTTVVNDSNYTIIILSNTTTNDTNQANSTFMELNISNLTVNSTNFTELVINATFEANTSSNLPNYSNFSNVTHIWNNTTSIQVFVNDSNVSYPNGTNLSLQNFSNVSQTFNDSNYSVTDFHVLINFSNNSSLEITDSTNTSNIGNNTSNRTNMTSENYSRVLTNISGTNESFSNMTVKVSEEVPENNTNTSVTFDNSFFLNLSQNLSYSNNTTINNSLLINDTRTSFNLSTYNDSNLTIANYSIETMNGSNNSWNVFNSTDISTAGGNNSTVFILYNVTTFAPSNDSTKNFTNSSIYNHSNFSSNTDNSSANITNLRVNLSIGSNDTNSTIINTTVYWDNMSFPNGTFESTYIETKNLTSPASTNWSNVTFFNFTNLTVNAPNSTNVSLNQSTTNTCLMINASTFKSNSCNFSADYSNGTNDTNASTNESMIVTNVTNFTNGTNFSYFLNVSNSSTLNGTSPSFNQTYITLNVSVLTSSFNGSNSSIFVQCYVIQNSTGTFSDCDESTLALLKQSPADLFGNLISNVVVQGACDFFNNSNYQSEYCNLTFNYSNGTNKTNATVNYTILITNSTNFTNGTNFTYYYNLTNVSIPVCMIPNTNLTYYTLNVTWTYPPSNCSNMSNGSNSSNGTNGSNASNCNNTTNGSNITNGSSNPSCVNNTNSSLFVQCLVVQNATGNFSNCSNSSLAYFGLNRSYLFNSSINITTNITIGYSNQTSLTNFTNNLSLVNSSNGSISDIITFYANLTSPITVNGTQLNLTNVSNFTRNFAQNRSDFMKAFNESNYSFNVGVSLFNSSHEIINSKNFTKTMFLIGNSSNSTLNETLMNNSFNFTLDYRYNDANQSFINIYSQNFSDTITNNSSLNLSNITRNYSSIVNSSLNYNITFLGFNATNNTGYNLSAIFYSNQTFGNISKSFYNLSSGNNNTTLNQNYTILVINASSGDASNFSSTSSLGINGSNLTYGNWSMNQSQPIFNGTQLVGFTTLNYTLNNVTGTYTNNSTALSYRNYTYQLFNLSQIQPAVGGNNTFNTYHYFLFDSNNVSGGINTTLTAQIDLVNSTDNSANTTYRLWDLLVCQNNGSCSEFYFQNDSFVSISGPNTTSAQNFTQNYSNNTSNMTGIDMNVTNTTNSSGLFLIQLNMSSNRTLANGSNYSLYNYSAFENISSASLEIDGYQNVSYLLFLSPVVNGSLTGLNRSYFSTQIATYNSNSTNLINRTLINQTTDLIWLPGGIVTVYNITTVNISTTNSSVNNTLNQQVNRSRLMPNSSAGVPYSDYNNSTVVIVYPNTTILWQSNTSNLSGFVASSGDSASFGGYQNCSFVTNISSTLYSNQSNITYGLVQSTCYYKNGSLEVNNTIKFLESDNGGTPYGNQNFTSSVDGVNVTNSTTKCNSMRRRMLMEKPAEAHKQGGSFTGSGNYIFISCFTGFGGASVININAIVDNQPDMNTCLTRINNERPQYTVQKLRQAVNNYNGSQ